MAMNDAVDAATDARERADRPIPSGRVRRCDVNKFATVTLTLATGLSVVFGWRAFAGALGLAAAILAYNLLHTRAGLGAILMAACRGLLVVWAGLAMEAQFDLLPLFALGLALYTFELTNFAAEEVEPGARSAASRVAVLALPAVSLPYVAATGYLRADWSIVLTAAIVLSAWLAWTIVLGLQRTRTRVRAVMAAIAGISLVDALFLCLLNRPQAAIVAGACFLATVAGQRRVAGS
jgi:4-hydroxybenzoate polyprenyltransferase